MVNKQVQYEFCPSFIYALIYVYNYTIRTTGECLKCIRNTGSFYCDDCLDGYYGNPLSTDPNEMCRGRLSTVQGQALFIKKK